MRHRSSRLMSESSTTSCSHARVADLHCPHVLVCVDPDGITAVTGPFPDAQAALCALDYEQRLDRETLEEARAISLAPVLPGCCPHTPPERRRQVRDA